MKYLSGIISILVICLTLNAETPGGIIVFTQEGCSRCEFTINYLKSKNINYTELATEVEANNTKMWDMIEKSGKPGVEKITMPVIVDKGNVYFSIENLEKLLISITGH